MSLSFPPISIVGLKHPLRYHAVQEFNKGVYDYIIATDEAGAYNEQDTDDDEEDNADEEEECKFSITAAEHSMN